jgi:hypothetical protein
VAVNARPNPENYYCLKYESARTIPYVFPTSEHPAPKAAPSAPTQVEKLHSYFDRSRSAFLDVKDRTIGASG